MTRSYLGTSLNPANAPLDTVGIPIVLTTAQRDEDFPAPLDNQRVQNLETAAIERWTGSAWVVDVNTGVGGAVEDLAPGTFGANETPGPYTFTDGLTVLNGLLMGSSATIPVPAGEWAASITGVPDTDTPANALAGFAIGTSVSAFNATAISTGVTLSSTTTAGAPHPMTLVYSTLTLNALEVTFGANDSAGTGFRLLRVPNS